MNVPLASLPAVYADESSNSGQNLLDPDQPVFTVAGVHLPDELAASIVDEVRSQLPSTQGEPKYGSLARSSRGRKALTRAFEQLPPGSTRSFVVNKPFMVMTKLVDTLVETRAHADGFNLYENGEALALADLLHMGGPVLGDAAAYRHLQQAFVDWVRQRTSTDELFAVVAAFKESIPTRHSNFAEYIEVLEYCRGVADETAADLAAGGQRDLLDPAVTSLYVLCTSFAETLGQFRLVHDESKVIDRHATELRMAHLLPDLARPGQFLKGLGATQIDFADSKAHPQLQLADWAAGAVRQWATHMELGGGNQFARDLEYVVRPWVVGTIWPTNPES
ncbi:DUF3800 domain-containing protein [Streptomyces sp. KS 21]|uniref:DUF3800 domain-containing protein n=1 Tax=Streptomyces sp. KS 21 TaxID=2485150 RepID=UPI0010634878|nr:DUF3800 domain-containing protein [Streptomyces sp. KS 21]TDU67095.1 uncharacterized protein DUF3800 [Streptomyces sp. KS 21]